MHTQMTLKLPLIEQFFEMYEKYAQDNLTEFLVEEKNP